MVRRVTSEKYHHLRIEDNNILPPTLAALLAGPLAIRSAVGSLMIRVTSVAQLAGLNQPLPEAEKGTQQSSSV